VFRNRGVSLALVGLFVWLTGCSTYTQIAPSEVADHQRVTVTLSDGERRGLYDPVVSEDTIKGRFNKDGTAVYSIPMDTVSEIGLDEANPAGTVPLVLFVGAAVVGLTLLTASVVYGISN